jgi:hypothetical protein
MKLIISSVVLFLFLSLAATGVLSPPNAHSQGPDLLEVDQLILFGTVAPGGSRTMNLSVGSGLGTHVGVEVRGLGQAVEGRFLAREADADSSPYSAREFLSVAPSEFYLEPGQRRRVEVSVNAPDDVGWGGRYAVIYVYTRPPEGEESVGVSAAIAVSVILTIEGSEVAREGELTEISVSDGDPFLPLEVAAVFSNRGNYHYRVSGLATLLDQEGREVAQSPIPRTAASVVPSFAQRLETSLSPAGRWEPGAYLLQVDVFTDDGRLVASRNHQVEIAADGFAIGGGGEPGSLLGLVSDRTDPGLGGLDLVLLTVTSIAVLGMLISLGTLVYVVRQKRT